MANLVQSNKAALITDGSSNVSLAFLSNVTAGNWVVVYTFSTDKANLSTGQMVNQTGVTFNTSQVTIGNVNFSGINYAPKIAISNTALTTSEADSVKLTFLATGQHVQVIIEEWNIPAGYTLQPSGLFGSGSSDYTGTSQFIDPGMFTTPENQYIVFNYAINDANLTPTCLDSNFTNTVNLSDATNTYNLAASTAVTSNPINLAPQFNLSSTANWYSWTGALYIQPPQGVVQSNSNSSVTTSVAKQYAVTTTTNNLLLASVYTNGTTPTLSGGPTWTQIEDNNFNSTQHITTFYATADGTQPTITASDPSATIMELHIFEAKSPIYPAPIDTNFTYVSPVPQTTSGTLQIHQGHCHVLAFFVGTAADGNNLQGASSGYPGVGYTGSGTTSNNVQTFYLQSTVTPFNSPKALLVQVRQQASDATILAINLATFDIYNYPQTTYAALPASNAG